MFRLTPVVRNLITINAIVFVAQWLVPTLTNYIALWGIKTPHFLPYQLFTYMFAHDGFWHIFMNMLMLAFSGPILEEFWGQKRFLMFYMAAGLGAAAFHVLMDLFFGLGSFSTLIGASGAVYGVMAAFGIIFADMELRLMFLPFSFKAKYLVLVLGSLAIINGFGNDRGDNVAHLTHLGGIVVAIIFIQYWRSRGRH
jgi:membrane associated rhomboid family serine protease